MRSLFIAACLCAAALCAAAAPIQSTAQDKKTDPNDKITVRVHLKKGTVIVGSPKATKLPIKTKYGTLEVPLAEVQGVQVGLHYEPGQKDAIEKAIKLLASPTYQERETGSKTLVDNGRFSLPLLPANDKDLEVVKRVGIAKDKINELYTDQTPFFDVVKTAEFEIKGDIQWDELEIVSHEKELGTIKVKLTSMTRINLSRKDGGDFKMQATNSHQWIDTGLYLTDDSKLVVTASGQVDLYPNQNPGQYLTGPNGSNQTNGKGGVWRGGALIAKVGNGTEFMLGERYSSVPGRTGTLYLMIVDNQWNVQSQGEYTVNIRLE